MCIGILAKWLSIQCLKHLDGFSEIMKMCSLTVEVQSNYYLQRGPHGCAVMFSFIPIWGLREMYLTKKVISERSVEGQASRDDALYLYATCTKCTRID